MKYRKLDVNGDYVFGTDSQFLVDTPETVAQAVRTKLKLYAGEWFLDTREGLDKAQILGNNTEATRDAEVQRVVLNTPGVDSLVTYDSEVDERSFTASATIDTIYGAVTIEKVF